MTMATILDIAEINRKRAVMKIPVVSLCVQAGVGTRTFYDALNGTYEATPATLAKLGAALQRFRLSYACDPAPFAVLAAYKAALVIAADHLKADARAVIFSDPGRKATADRQWREAARVRQLAYWITVNLGGLRGSMVARAAGVTKQAISAAIKELEDNADPDVKRAMRHLEEVFS